MDGIKVLVIDENILVRRAITGILNKKEENIIVTASGDVSDCEKMVQNENPDVIFLDIENSKSDGYSIFNTLRVRFPKLPIVVISSRSDDGAQAALYALRNGAVDVITMPENNNALLLTGRHLEKRLPPIIKGTARIISRDTVDRWLVEKTVRQQIDAEVDEKKQRSHIQRESTRLVVIGTGMGGPKALNTMLKDLPADFPVPIVVVQHFPKFYTHALAHRLRANSKLSIREAADGAELMPGTVWLAPGGYHCEVQQNGNRSFLKVHRGPRENEVRPSIDVLFRSAARIHGSRVLGVILSGNGSDGLAGVKAIQDKGGKILVQDPADAMVDTLPLSVIREDGADYYYPAEQFGDELIKHIVPPQKSKRGAGYYNYNLYNRDPEYFKSV